MTSRGKSQLKKCRGIIVWDFDGVLFDIKAVRQENYTLFKKYGASDVALKNMRDRIRKSKMLFSVASALRVLKKSGIRIPVVKFRREFYRTLASQNRLYKDAEKILHGLKKLGFCHFILSFGSAPAQYKKIHLGCGRGFARHFEKIMVTSGHKYPFLRALAARHKGIPIFFIDDTKEHIELVNEHVPAVKTIFYTNRQSLAGVKRVILKHAK